MHIFVRHPALRLLLEHIGACSRNGNRGAGSAAAALGIVGCCLVCCNVTQQIPSLLSSQLLPPAVA